MRATMTWSSEEIVRLTERKFDDLEQAIASLEAALEADRKLKLWPHAEDRRRTRCQLLLLLGETYYNRRLGERAENLERALAAGAGALEVVTKESSPVLWAQVRHLLGRICFERTRGERADNLEQAKTHYEAALTVRTREAFPDPWAKTQNNLAIVYANRIRGRRADNLERAIAFYKAALAVHTREAFPYEWALTQNNLALAYSNRIRGERTDNIERAIGAYEAALAVFTPEAYAYQWAITQSNLANAYLTRTHGERAENLERAIALYEASLTVRTREAFPYDWAKTQSNFADAYLNRIRGERVDNIERAIAHCEAALTVYTRAATPTEWARTQNNLGVVLRNRVKGKRADNIEQAIERLEAALTVRTPEALPYDWARTQSNLAGAYSDRVRGRRAVNLQRASAGHEAALTVFTRVALPRDHLETLERLGHVLLAQRAWRRAANALSEARETFLLLLGQGLDEVEVHGLVELAGSLFTNSAYAAAELGEPTRAFRLVCEGRARLMATALRLQALAFAPGRRRRLEVLRTEIREESQGFAVATGLQRAEILDRLSRLRGKLSATIAAAEATSSESNALAQAYPLVANGGAVVAPIVTDVGGKLLVVAAAPNQNHPRVIVVDLPKLTSGRLKTLMRGDKARGFPGWLGAFARDAPWSERKERASRAIEEIGGELWTLLGGPLERALSDVGATQGSRLVFMPSGGLGLLPLGIAQDPSSGRRLLDTYEIAFAPSLAAMTKAMREAGRPVRPSLAAVVNPTGDLVFAPIEGALVAAHFRKERRVVLDARTGTSNAVLACLKGKTHWHFSTHGAFDSEAPRRSALAMKGGEGLSVGDLLSARRLGRPRLVVLSACETGLHDIVRTPEEFVGLPGAFMTIGARAVLGTLWPVDDRAAALLTALFYDAHLDEGLAPAAALRKAQLWIMSATGEDLGRYIHEARARSRLKPNEARQVERALMGTIGDAVRFFNVTGGPPPTGGANGDGRSPLSADGHRPSRPFAHPVFWGGFVITGL